jgi:hypothetical protein
MAIDQTIKKLPTEELVEIVTDLEFASAYDFGRHFVWIEAVLELKRRGIRLPHVAYE